MEKTDVFIRRTWINFCIKLPIKGGFFRICRPSKCPKAAIWNPRYGWIDESTFKIPRIYFYWNPVTVTVKTILRRILKVLRFHFSAHAANKAPLLFVAKKDPAEGCFDRFVVSVSTARVASSGDDGGPVVRALDWRIACSDRKSASAPYLSVHGFLVLALWSGFCGTIKRIIIIIWWRCADTFPYLSHINNIFDRLLYQ